MNGFKLLVSVITTSLIIAGCVSTENTIISEENGVIKYQSRCHNIEKSESDKIEQKVLSRQPPRYPMEAAIKRIEGYTILVHDISSEGKTINVDVIEAYPSDVFNKQAIDAISNWRYKPNSSTCLQVRLDFKMG